MTGNALLKTPLHPWHEARGARLVEFGGWSMPVQYTSIVEEHQAVRHHVGLFDISHMGRLRFTGPDALPWLDQVTTNHVGRLAKGQIQYSLMTNERGGIIDDVLVYRLPEFYLVVCNASNREAVVAQFERHRAGFEATLTDETLDTAMMAVQGPHSWATVAGICIPKDVDALSYYHVAEVPFRAEGTSFPGLLSRTGYTGEDGFELIMPRDQAEPVWEKLLRSGADFEVRPCGLGARDTLRFEAGMPLYGHELSEEINPYAAGLGWAVKLRKGEFVGCQALLALQSDPGQARVGLELEGKRIARQGCPVTRDGRSVGVVTSGTFSPTLSKSLAMALVEPTAAEVGTRLTVDVRGRDEPAQVIPLPFYSRSQPE